MAAPFYDGDCTVTFQDHGQDFLTWHIQAGRVVGCEPFQAWCWVGIEVTTTQLAGERLGVRRASGSELLMNYPLVKVEPLRMVPQPQPAPAHQEERHALRA